MRVNWAILGRLKMRMRSIRRVVVTRDLSESNIQSKTIEMKLSGVREATRRSRFVFLVMTIGAVTILVSLWNSTLGWDRGLAFPTVASTDNNTGVLTPDALLKIKENQGELTREWISRLNVSVGLFGIRVSAADLAVVGSVGLVIIMVWFFFSQRRENRAVVTLLRYCRKQSERCELDKSRANFVYECIVQSILFIDMCGGDQPISLFPDEKRPRNNKIIRVILRVLAFLPPITILAI